MRQPKGRPHHEYAPKAWRRTAVITGDYDMDASIVHCKNKAVPGKLKMYVAANHEQSEYGTRSGYNGYSGYSGDE